MQKVRGQRFLTLPLFHQLILWSMTGWQRQQFYLCMCLCGLCPTFPFVFTSLFTTQDSSQINNSSFPAPYPLASGSIFVCVALLKRVNMHFCKVYVWHSWTLFYAIKVQVVVTDRDMEKHFSTWALTGWIMSYTRCCSAWKWPLNISSLLLYCSWKLV